MAYTDEKSLITFKFLKPVGFSVPNDLNHGNYWPAAKTTYKEVPGQVGLFPFEGDDMDFLHEVKLEDEFPKELPDIFDDVPDEVRREYYTRQAGAAADAHNRNNEVRRVLKYHVDKGHIEIVSDTFMDHLKSKKLPKAEASSPKKSATKPTD